MTQQIVLFEQITSFEFLLNRPQSLLRILPRINLIVVAGFKVGCEDALRVKCFIAWQDLERNIEVLHFVVTKGDVDVDGFVFAALQQQLFVNLGCLLVMASQIVDSC